MSLEPYFVFRDFWTGVAMGHYDAHSHQNIFGENPSIGTTAFETMWDQGGKYIFVDDTGTILQISSSDTSDHGDTANDTGAKTIRLFGLDTDFNEQDELITLDGQGQVATVNVYSRVHEARVISVSTNGINIGDIYIGTGTSTGGIPPTIFGKIRADMGRTAMAIYTVPASKKGLITSFWGTILTAKSLHLELFVRSPGESLQYCMGADVSPRFERLLIPPITLEEKTDIRLDGKMDVGVAGEGHAGFDIGIVPDV